MSLPKLPEQVSSDGREIWDWAARLGKWTAREQRKRELRQAISDIQSKCGGCDFWMTSDCPREVHNNRIGRSQGPSMSAPICGKFVMKKWDADRLEKCKAELNQLETAGAGEKGKEA